MSQPNWENNQYRSKGKNRHQFHPYQYQPFHNGRAGSGPIRNNYHLPNSRNRFVYTSRPFTISNKSTRISKNGRKKEKSARPQPFQGTEEYNMEQIQKTSDMIKKQLMMPQSETDELIQFKEPTPLPNYVIFEPTQEKTPEKSCGNSSKSTKSASTAKYNVEDMHNKIINHISNLKHGKKVNLICSSSSSGYDNAIQNIQKKKRLQLSKALREMCSNQTTENSEFINSIMPDIGIKIDELPLEIIKELSNTLDIEFENDYPTNIKTEIMDEVTEATNDSHEECFFFDSPSIKAEAIESNNRYFHNVESPQLTQEFQSTSVQEPEQSPETPETPEIETNETPIQTEPISLAIPNNYQENAASLSEAVDSMMEIDREIERLTKLRQAIYENIKKLDVATSNSLKDAQVQTQTETQEPAQPPQTKPPKISKLNIDRKAEKVLIIKRCNNLILAGTECGTILYLNGGTGKLLHILHVSDVPITSICFHKGKKGRTIMYVGSQQFMLQEFVLETRKLTKCISIGDAVQCTELGWNQIFIGTASGYLRRYSLQKSVITFDDRIADNSILAIKATQEGARRVLLVASKNAPVCIRDALSGLHMRTMFDLFSPTVYSLLLDNNLVYCGTTHHDILVYNFHDGNLIHTYKAASKGIGCVKIVKNLLFASCFNGLIYVYDVKTKSDVGVIPGPGGVILSMEVFGAFVVVGTMGGSFKSIPIPLNMLSINK